MGEGFAQADVVVEGEFRTQVQTHCCLETHAVVATGARRPHCLHVDPVHSGVRRELAQVFGLPLERCASSSTRWAGFRLEVGRRQLRARAVLLSRQARAPVRWCSIAARATGQRQPAGDGAALRIGARRDGRCPRSRWIPTDGGRGPGRRRRQLRPGDLRLPNFAIAQSDVFINAGPGSAMRAPGNVPGAYALNR
jgi:xanthine dehydrogenase YagR molybdenum-binding subunit